MLTHITEMCIVQIRPLFLECSLQLYIPFLRLLLAGEDRQPVTVPKNEQSEFRLEERPEMCKHGIDAFEICNEIQPTA